MSGEVLAIKRRVLVWRSVPMSNVWSKEKTDMRCIDEYPGKYHRHFAAYSAMQRGRFED